MYLVTHRNITNYVFRNPDAKRILLPRYCFYLIGSIGSIRHSYWNGIALIFEMTPSLAQVATDPLAVLGICLLAFLLIPITKREQSIIDLTSAPVKPSEIDEICNEVASEFVLSEREAEILKLIAKGNTANGIANKLFISPNTVNTHIRHIYDKVGIHKRSELLEYLNMRKDDSVQ